MKASILIIGLLTLIHTTFAQTPQVPAKMKFADLQLTITKAARHKIQKEVDKLRKNNFYFQKYVEKADLYFPVIEEAFREEGCPDEIKYLMIQESGFNAVAVSSSNAVGYWQFKKATGIEVGLKIANGIDERKSIKSASHGAGIYMFKNNKRINNWIYTVMAYNTGVGGAQTHIKDKYRNAKKMEIGTSTHWYVIKFLAHKIAFEQEIGTKAHKQKLLIVTAKGGQTVKQIAKKHKVTVEAAKPFNEWIGLSKRIPHDKKYYVVLPVRNDGRKGDIPVKGEVAVIEETKENYDDRSDVLILTVPTMTKLVTINGRPAVIPAKEESVVTLARKGGITQKKFRKYNELQSFSSVIAGMPYFYKKKKSKALVPFHTVQSGESTWSIAQKYGMKEWSLRTKNRMAKREALVLGRVLWLNKARPERVAVQIKPVQQVVVKEEVLKEEVVQEKVVGKEPKVEEVSVSTPPIVEYKEEIKTKQTSSPAEVPLATQLPVVEETEKKKGAYIVKQGDTYYGISRKFGFTVQELKELNKLSHEDLFIGQVLSIEQSKKTLNEELKVEDKEEVPKGAFFEYEIQQGDTMYSVSKKFNVAVDEILKWNNKLTIGLSVGEKIKIKKKQTD